MGYYRQLDFLERALAGRAIDPAEAINTLMQLDQQRTENRRSRRQAEAEQQAGALDALVTTAQTAASEGQAFSEVRPLLESITQAAGMPSMPYRKLPGIEPLFDQGYSTLDPQVDAEDEALISQMVFDNVSPGGEGAQVPTPFESVRRRVHSEFSGSPAYGVLAPSIDSIIERAYNRAIKGL